MPTVWVKPSQTQSRVWIMENGGTVRTFSVCCSAVITRMGKGWSAPAYCSDCKTETPPMGMSHPIEEWQLVDHARDSGSIVSWIHNWTFIPKEDIGVDIAWEEEEQD